MTSIPAGQHLFVYGTLRRDQGHELNQLLSRHASFVGRGTLQGRLYVVEEFPGAVASDDPRDVVHGEVYSLRSPSRVLPKLDEYEECDPAHADRGLYRRERTTVVMQDGRAVQAWVYLFNGSTSGLKRIASGDFTEVRVPTIPVATRRS